MSTVADRGDLIRKLAVPAMAIVGGLVAAFFLLRGGGDETELGMLEEGRPDVGSPAPDFALADVRDGGETRQLSDFEGNPVVLNWYATWCAPCRDEIPLFQEAQDALGDDVAFLLVNLEEPRDRAEGMLDELGASMTAVLDSEGEVAERYRVTGMPTTYFIDADGTVESTSSGGMDEEQLQEALAGLGLEYQDE
jgi:thiol-disulfide isomerase/thioredoxin